MSSLLTPRNVTVAVGGLGALYYTSTKVNLFRTPAVQSIEDRYTAGGGTPTHLPAQATKLGDSEHITPPHTSSVGGVGTKGFREKISDQKAPVSGPKAKLNKAMYNNPGGK